MLAPVVLALVIGQTGVGITNPRWQERPLHEASTAPDPVTTEQPDAAAAKQPWPPAGVFRPGGAVTEPKLIKGFPPHYPPESMRAKVQGAVLMEAVVLTDGTVGEVRVVRSLDKKHGLDDEAVKTVKQWRFTAGKKNEIAVPVVVEVKMSFTIGK